MRKEPLRQSSQLHAKLRSISPPNTVSLSRGSPGNPPTAAADNASFSPPRDLGGGGEKKVPLHSRGGSTARGLGERKN